MATTATVTAITAMTEDMVNTPLVVVVVVVTALASTVVNQGELLLNIFCVTRLIVLLKQSLQGGMH